MSDEALTYAVSDFVAYANQTLEYAYPSVTITGELANFRVSKNKWVYFDLKDENASLRFFGSVYQLQTQLADGMLLAVRGTPRLHPQFGFSVTVQNIQLVGEGTIKRAAALLENRLAKEGLFDPMRKRSVSYPPASIALVASGESAAYADFIKILHARWAGITIAHYDVQVQGVDAPGSIVQAIAAANQGAELADVLVLIRGGGSADDLQAFNEEAVVRAVSGSRIPTVVAIGHETDTSLAEMAADVRASTPSNAAELLTPDKASVHSQMKQYKQTMRHIIRDLAERQKTHTETAKQALVHNYMVTVERSRRRLELQRELLNAYDPTHALERGYAVIRRETQLVREVRDINEGDIVDIEVRDAFIRAAVTAITKKEQ